MPAIRTALISVSDKTGLAAFARGLARLGVTLLSTGGTAAALREAGVAATEVSDYTGFPEMLDGRVKTLHPKLYAGILARRGDSAHRAALEKAAIAAIDLVAVNLYPFERAVAKPGATLAEAIENIDIGGPALLRAAAKNHADVAALCDPADYAPVLAEMQTAGCELSAATRFRLALKAFAHTAAYDAAITDYLGSLEGGRGGFPPWLSLQFEKVCDLRYGENPHQAAALYRDRAASGGLASAAQLQGKELSYNNLADADAAWECVSGIASPACVIVKHANPCGAALGATLAQAYERAFSTDPVSAFGGIIAFNRPLDGAAAEAVAKQFAEVVIAPAFDEAARRAFAAKPAVRLLAVPPLERAPRWDFKRIGGGLLAQTPDAREVQPTELRVASRRKPTDEELADLLFAWRVAKFVKSNAIVFAGGGRTLGVGAGQMSRVDAARFAAMKAQGAGHSLAGSVVASDAFFPFRDGVDVIAQAGARAVIQPGGSVRDAEVVAAADEHGMAMVFTGVRHFRH